MFVIQLLAVSLLYLQRYSVAKKVENQEIRFKHLKKRTELGYDVNRTKGENRSLPRSPSLTLTLPQLVLFVYQRRRLLGMYAF